MSLIKRLEEQAKWHERQTWIRTWDGRDPDIEYSLADEDLRALLQEAADRIKGLSILVERQQHHSYRRGTPGV